MAFNKKGYFFVIDAFIGSVIIFIALVLITGSDVKPSQIQYDYAMAEDYSIFLMNTHIENLNNPYVNNLTSLGVITNTKHTIMEQVDEFYYNARYVCSSGNNSCIDQNMNYSTNMIQILTDSLVSTKYGFSFVMMDSVSGRNDTIYSRGDAQYNDSRMIIVSKKITFLQINSTKIFGPNIVEIKIWV